MSTLLENPFSEYLLDDTEMLQGVLLNPYQRMRLQNILADFAKQKLALKYDPTDPTYGLLCAELDGKILLLQQLLDDATSAATPAISNP